MDFHRVSKGFKGSERKYRDSHRSALDTVPRKASGAEAPAFFTGTTEVAPRSRESIVFGDWGPAARGMAVPAMIQNLIDLRTLCPPRVPTVVARYFRDRDAEVVPGSARFQLPACPECLMLAGGMRSQGRNLLGAGLAASCYSWQALPSMRRVKELLGLMQRPVLAGTVQVDSPGSQPLSQKRLSL